MSKISETKSQEKVIDQQIVRSQEIIVLSSHSEKETSESKKGHDSLWKKKCSKYVPEETLSATDKENEGWLKKRYPSDFNNKSKAIESFRKVISSKDTWSFDRGNEQRSEARCFTLWQNSHLQHSIPSFYEF